MVASKRIYRFVSVVIWICLLALGGQVLAQGGTAPIQIGQNAAGTLTADVNTAQFVFIAAGGETATVQVLALSAGFAPRFSILNPAHVEILTVDNADGKATLTGNAVFNTAGVYTIVISGENGSTGQFVLSLQPGAPLPTSVTLTINQPVTATVGSQTPVQDYRFNTTSLGAVAVTVLSQTTGAQVTLYDDNTGKTIASADTGVVGTTWQLPTNGRAYRVEVRAAGSADTAFSICIGTCPGNLLSGNPVAAPPPEVGAASPTPQVADTACMVASSVAGSANLRSGPGTIYAILGGLPPGQTIPVLGEWTGGGWYEVNANGATLWVGSTVVTLSGDCSTLARIPAPANAPLAPTQVPTARPTDLPTPTNMPTSTPTDTPTPEMLPDLAVQGMTITQDSPTHARVTFDVYNKGTVDVTQPFYVYVCITALCVEKQITLPVRAGGSTELFVDLNHPSSTTPETVAVAVDSRGEIRELSEDNNTTSLSDVSLNF